ncbi:hypothetical protein [Rhizobium mesoamericanum]|uniref:hypothetical protein n=1 Tax=Rhizobium mesoamericanum TaxID=1079800 RepID=UPI00042A5353|nr:hypothetical protein [Rhizobium mesoamericanum]
MAAPYSLRSSSVLLYGVAALLSFLVMLPVLIWPHYGLFSDAGQLIEFPRQVIEGLPQSLKLLRPTPDGRWNPLFHGLSTFLYALHPDSPRTFFFAQWLMFAGTAICITALIYDLTRSVAGAIFGLLVFCTSSSLFENFYTLDKVEPRITLFSALGIFAFSRIAAKEKLHTRGSIIYVAYQFLIGTLIIFSKETGIFLTAAFGAVWLLTLVKKPFSEFRYSTFWSFVPYLTSTLAFIVLFRFLSRAMDYRYVKYEVSFDLIKSNVRYYLETSPELALALVIAALNLWWILFRPTPEKERAAALTKGLVSSAIFVYFAGITWWRWPLDYYLLPAHFLSAVLLGTAAAMAVRNRARIAPMFRMPLACLFIVVWLALFAYRITDGVAIYAFDSAKDKIATYLANPRFSGKRIILPLTHPNNAELGERLEFFINRSRGNIDAVDIYNFWEPPSNNLTNFARFADSAGLPPTRAQLEYAVHFRNRFVLWGFGPQGRDPYMEILNSFEEKKPSFDSMWRLSFLRKGDLILAPTGSKIVEKFHARGLSIHTRSAEEFSQESPLDLQDIGGISSGLGPVRLGWEVFEVESDDLDPANSEYTLSALRVLNKRKDVTPENARTAIYNDKVFPKEGILLGDGWFDIESAHGTSFRWMSTDSSILVIGARPGNCEVKLDAEPLRTPSTSPVSISSPQATLTPATISSRGEVTINFISTGAQIQKIGLHVDGGLAAPPTGDPRLLKMRLFRINDLACG